MHRYFLFSFLNVYVFVYKAQRIACKLICQIYISQNEMKRIVYVWVCKFLNIGDWSSLDFCQFWFLLYAVLCMNEDAFIKYTLKFLKFAVLFVSRFDLNLLKKLILWKIQRFVGVLKIKKEFSTFRGKLETIYTF